jgi:hypothetical protein
MEKQESVVPAWEFLLLLTLVVTVFSLSSSSSMHSFPEIGSNPKLQQLERDPYDIRPERKISDARTLVEIGL